MKPKPRRANLGKRKQGLRIIVKDGQLSITVGIDCLVYAIQASPAWDDLVAPMYRIVDKDLFVKEMRNALDDDKDDVNPMQKLLDDMAQVAIESGSQSLEEVPVDEIEKEREKRMKGLV